MDSTIEMVQQNGIMPLKCRPTFSRRLPPPNFLPASSRRSQPLTNRGYGFPPHTNQVCSYQMSFSTLQIRGFCPRKCNIVMSAIRSCICTVCTLQHQICIRGMTPYIHHNVLPIYVLIKPSYVYTVPAYFLSRKSFASTVCAESCPPRNGVRLPACCSTRMRDCSLIWLTETNATRTTLGSSQGLQGTPVTPETWRQLRKVDKMITC